MTGALHPHQVDQIASEIASEMGLVLRNRLMVASARVEYADKDVLAAAADVARAVTRMEMAKYSPGEASEQRRLVNAAKKLRTALKEARERG